MALYAFVVVLVCWMGWGCQMSFGKAGIHFIGRPNVVFGWKVSFMLYLPNATMVYFQFVFTAITLILIAGALLGRMNFYAWMLFVPLWLTFSYTICAFSVWSPNGWLSKMGIIDYSGGFVIRISSRVAGFTIAYWVITNYHIISFIPLKKKIHSNFRNTTFFFYNCCCGKLWLKKHHFYMTLLITTFLSTNPSMPP